MSYISGENDHFWYRVEKGFPYVDSQRDDKAFGRGDGTQVIFCQKQLRHSTENDIAICQDTAECDFIRIREWRES